MTGTTSPETYDATPPTSGRHPVSVGHLVMGVAFVSLCVVWALVVSDVVEGADIRWLLPVPWVLAGGAGLVASVLVGRRRHETRHRGWASPLPGTAPGTDPTTDPEAPAADWADAPVDTTEAR